MNITLKQIKSFRGTDGTAFSAQIYDGSDRLGEVSNGGSGGCNDYSFVTREAGERFERAVAAWLLESGEESDFEVEDIFIAQLMDEADFEKAKRANARRGFPVTLLIEARPQQLGGRIFYDDVRTVGVRSPEQAEALVKQHRSAGARVRIL